MTTWTEFSQIAGYVGSLFMVLFSFTLNPLFAIFGLVLLTLQAHDAKMWNLVALNLISIAGFTFNFFA